MKQHPLAGKKQSPEHIAKRVAAIAAARGAWTDGQREQWSRRVAEANRRRNASENLIAFRKQKGHVPWNKGNDWRDGLTPEEVRAKAAHRARVRRNQSEKRKVHERVSALIRANLKSRGADKSRKSWPEYVGYGAVELIAHLKGTIPTGYTWEDYLDGRLQLDHIVPVSVHNFESVNDIDFQRCWALSNLQLLPAEVNNRKKDKLIFPFQPSLAFSAPISLP